VADPPPSDERPPAAQPDVIGWIVEALTHLPSLTSSLRPGVALPTRVRVHLSQRVVDRAGGPVTQWIQEGRASFVGPPPADDRLDALAAFADASAAATGPVDATALAVEAGEPTAGAARAVVAGAVIAGLAERSARSAIDRVRGRRRRDPARLLSEVALAAAVAPLLAPAVVVSGAARTAGVLAPAVPPVVLEGAAASNLVAHVLAAAVPDLLGHAAVRTIALANPLPLVVAVRLHGSAATLEVGQGRVVVHDGIRPEAIAVIEGPLDSLVDVAVASVTRGLGPVAPR